MSDRFTISKYMEIRRSVFLRVSISTLRGIVISYLEVADFTTNHFDLTSAAMTVPSILSGDMKLVSRVT